MVRFFFFAVCLFAASPSAAQPESEKPSDPKTLIELKMAVGHCLAYYDAAESSAANEIEKHIAESGKDILEISLVLAELDKSLARNIAKILKTEIERIPGDELFDLYDEYCDRLSDQVSND